MTTQVGARSHSGTLGLIVVALLAATVWVYAPALQGDFLTYDDPKYVSANPVVQQGLSQEGLAWAFGGVHDANWIPLVWLSLMVDHQLFGDDPRGYHATNVALHALATLLLLLALRRFTGELWRPAFVAGVFALHPLHVQSVAWIAERKDVLSAVFWMATLLAWARYLERPGAVRYAQTFVLLSLGLLCKATAVTLPFVLLLLDFWPARRFAAIEGRAAEIRRAVLEKLPLLVPVALACSVTLFAQSTGGAIGMAQLSLGERIGHAFVAYGFYLEKAVWPAKLMFFYPHPELSPADPRVLLSAAAVLGATALIAAAARRRPAAHPLAIGWLWFLGTLVPMLGIVQVGAQGMADRYTYIPLVGLAVAVAWLPGLATGGRARAAAVAAALVLCVFGWSARAEARYWRASEPLYRRAVEIDPDNFIAHYELARLLNAERRPDEAETHAREAVRLVPVWSDAYLNLGAALLEQDRPDEATTALRRALARDARSLDARRLLARALRVQGKLPEAKRLLAELIGVQPGDARARLELGHVAAQEGDRMTAWHEYVVVWKLAGEHPYGLEAKQAFVALVAGWPDAPPAARDTARRLASELEPSKTPD